MPTKPRMKDRLFTALCIAGAGVVLVVGFSRGNPRVALGGAAVLLGYVALQTLARRLTPGARLVMGSEADAAERLVQFKATRLAGQVAIGLTILGIIAAALWDWAPGLWIAGACATVLFTFVAALVAFSRATRAPRSAERR
ncbi:MAG: hypothetical protein WBG89_10510 [Ornithinimicrobium sp.]